VKTRARDESRVWQERVWELEALLDGEREGEREVGKDRQEHILREQEMENEIEMLQRVGREEVATLQERVRGLEGEVVVGRAGSAKEKEDLAREVVDLVREVVELQQKLRKSEEVIDVVCVCVRVCVTCVCLCGRVCAHAVCRFVLSFADVRICTHTRIHTHTHIHARTYTHTHTHTHKLSLSLTHTH